MGGPGAPRHDVGRAVARDEVGEGGKRTGVDVGREVDPRRGGHERAAPDVGPPPVVGREHLVVVAGVAGCDHAGRDDGDPRRPVDVDAARQPPPARAVRAGCARTRSASSLTCTAAAPTSFATRRTLSTQSPRRMTSRPPSDAQRGVEIGERLEQEPGAVRSVERAGEDGVVEHEQRDDDVVGAAPPVPTQGGRSRAGRG